MLQHCLFISPHSVSEPVKTAQCRSSRARLGDSLTVGESTAALRSTEGGPVLGSDLPEQLMQQCVVMQRGQIRTRTARRQEEGNQRPPLLDPDSAEIARHVSCDCCSYGRSFQSVVSFELMFAKLDFAVILAV